MYDTCSICFNDYNFLELRWKCKKCNNNTHEKCIYNWNNINKTCPFCRNYTNTTNIYSNRAILCVFFIAFLIKCCELLSLKNIYEDHLEI